MPRRSELCALLPLAWILFLALSAAPAEAGWYQQNSPTSNHLTGVDFVDPDYGWICGAGGTVLHTTNGGATWTLQDLGSAIGVNDIDFADRDHGYAVGDLYTLWRTVDGGANWEMVLHVEQSPGLSAVSVVDPQTVWVTGSSEHFASVGVSTDGGDLWQWGFVQNGDDAAGNDIFGMSGQEAYLSCNLQRYDASWYSKLFRTVDSGESFDDVCGLNSPEQEVQFLGPLTGFFGPKEDAPETGVLRKTVDGGDTWTTTHFDGTSTHMSFASAEAGWVTGVESISATTDGGTTWNLQETGAGQRLLKIQFVNPMVGTAVGENGLILHTTDGGWSGASAESEAASGGWSLRADPNPFTNTVRITCSTAGADGARIAVVPASGRTVRGRAVPTGGGAAPEGLGAGRGARG